MSTYNDGTFISECIDSVINQDYQDFEFIIINDASTDDTDELIKSYSDERIVYVKNDSNKGLVRNLNKGLELAKGEYVARIDSDDKWLDTAKIMSQVDFLEANPDYGLVGSSAKKGAKR